MKRIATLFLVLLLPWSGWYLWAAAGLALAALGLYLWGRTQKRFRRSRGKRRADRHWR